jgi:N utilization substance protein B
MSKAKPQGGRARTRARRLALQGLYQWQISGATAADIAAQLSATQNTKDTDTEYFEELLRKTVAANEMLAEAFAPHLDRPAQQLDPIERGILLLGTYELKERLDVPYRVVLNEAMELAKTFGAEDSHKYINAVLDKTARELRRAERVAG